MATQLNIKSDEARTLAEDLARLTGKSMTEVIVESLRDRLARLHDASGAEEERCREKQVDFDRLIEGTRSLWKDELLSLEHGRLLYDDTGLPR